MLILYGGFKERESPLYFGIHSLLCEKCHLHVMHDGRRLGTFG